MHTYTIICIIYIHANTQTCTYVFTHKIWYLYMHSQMHYNADTYTRTHAHNIQTHRPTHTHTHKYSHNYRSCISTCLHSHKCRHKKNTHMCLHIITRDTCTPVATCPDMPTVMWAHRDKGEMHTKTHNNTGLGVSKYSKRA